MSEGYSRLLSSQRETETNRQKQKQNKNMKNKTMLKVTNAKVMFPPFEGWDTNFIVKLAEQHEPRFTCDEMVLSESVVDGEVTLNGQTYLVTYDKDAVDHTDGCELPAKITLK